MNYPELAKVNSMSCPSCQHPICGSFYLAKSPWELGEHTICLGIVLVTISFKCNTNAVLKENILYVVKCSPAVYLEQHKLHRHWNFLAFRLLCLVLISCQVSYTDCDKNIQKNIYSVSKLISLSLGNKPKVISTSLLLFKHPLILNNL